MKGFFLVVLSLMVCRALSIQTIRSTSSTNLTVGEASAFLEKGGAARLGTDEKIPYHVDNQQNIFATLGSVFSMDVSSRFLAQWDNQKLTFSTDSRLPPGIHFGAGGVLHGIPIVMGEYPIVITAIDDRGEKSTSSQFDIHVNTYGSNVVGAFCDIGCWQTTTGPCQEAVRGNNRCWPRDPDGQCPQGSIDCTQTIYEKNLDLIEFNVKFDATHAGAGIEDLDADQEMALVNALAENCDVETQDIRIVRIMIAEGPAVPPPSFIEAEYGTKQYFLVEYDVDFAIIEPDSARVMHVVNHINEHFFRHNLAVSAASYGVPINVDSLDVSDIEIDFLTGEELKISFEPTTASASLTSSVTPSISVSSSVAPPVVLKKEPTPTSTASPSPVVVAAPAPAPILGQLLKDGLEDLLTSTHRHIVPEHEPTKQIRHDHSFNHYLTRSQLKAVHNPGVPAYSSESESQAQFRESDKSGSDKAQYFHYRAGVKLARSERMPEHQDSSRTFHHVTSHADAVRVLDELVKKYT